jgi:hypothetical protein
LGFRCVLHRLHERPRLQPGSDAAQRWVDGFWYDFSLALATVMEHARLSLLEDSGYEHHEETVTDTAGNTTSYTPAHLRGRHSKGMDKNGSDPEARDSMGKRKLDKGVIECDLLKRPARSPAADEWFRARRLTTRLGRARRLHLLLRSGRRTSSEATVLIARLSRSGDIDEVQCASLAPLILHVDRLVEKLARELEDVRARAAEARLRRWRDSLLESRRRAHNWLKGDQPRDTLTVDDEGPADSIPASLLKLKRRWRKIWDRELPPEHRWRASLDEWGPADTDAE